VVTPDPWGYVLALLRRRQDPPPGVSLAVGDAAVRVEAPGEPPRRLAGPERDAFMTTARWPFREVVALRPLTGGRRTVLTLPLEVGQRTRLETAVAMHPDHWVAFPASWVEFAVEIAGERVFGQRLDPQREISDRRWVEVSIPLARWTGRTVPLELSVACERPEAETLEMTGFAVPRVLAP
jgi:hypothetical protein